MRYCSDPTSNGQASVYPCHPWISMLAHTVHQCIYQSAITCINNVKLIYTSQVTAETNNRVWSPINAIGRLSVDHNPVPYSYSSEENICNMIRCSRVGQYIECTGKITIRKQMIKLYYMQYGFVALCLSFVCVKAGFIFPTTKEYQESVLRSFLS